MKYLVFLPLLLFGLCSTIFCQLLNTGNYDVPNGDKSDDFLVMISQRVVDEGYADSNLSSYALISVCQLLNVVPENFSNLGPTSTAPECTSNSQCSKEHACHDNKCDDPCPKVCGRNSICEVINNTPTCACRPGYIGNPVLGCSIEVVPECTSNLQCPINQACQDNKCVDPCATVCGKNTVCEVTNHNHNCVCKPGFTGNPILGCISKEPHECESNNKCLDHLACIDNICVDPCNQVCGPNSMCLTTHHYPACYCEEGFIGNPVAGCEKEDSRQCVSNNDCHPNLACKDYSCVDPCPGVCGANAVCTITKHYPVCACKAGFSGDPSRSCEADTFISKRSPPGGKKRYFIGKYLVPWKKAITECNFHNMTLASVYSQREQNELRHAIREYKPETDLWMSGTVHGSGNFYYWQISGNQLNFTNWDTAEPKLDGVKRCMGVSRGSARWFTPLCRYSMFFICEYYQA